ncbi:hypothetical protein JCM11491_001105 [Sporobolomyces phaffii]
MPMSNRQIASYTLVIVVAVVVIVAVAVVVIVAVAVVVIVQRSAQHRPRALMDDRSPGKSLLFVTRETLRENFLVGGRNSPDYSRTITLDSTGLDSTRDASNRLDNAGRTDPNPVKLEAIVQGIRESTRGQLDEGSLLA